MTKLEILQETYDYYVTNRNPRALVNTHCSYITPDGAMCAVGRCAGNPQELEDIGGVFENIAYLIEWKPEYIEHAESLTFWSDLQMFHDIGMNWNSDQTLTTYGKKYFNELVRKYR